MGIRQSSEPCLADFICLIYCHIYYSICCIFGSGSNCTCGANAVLCIAEVAEQLYHVVSCCVILVVCERANSSANRITPPAMGLGLLAELGVICKFSLQSLGEFQVLFVPIVQRREIPG